MKKLIISIFLLLSIIIGGFYAFIRQEIDTYLILGDYLSTNLEDKEVESFTSLIGHDLQSNKEVKKVNSSFTSSSLTSDKLLEMIEKDAAKIEDSGAVGLVDSIKKSKYITITVGMNDILPLLRFNSLKQEIEYDQELIDRKLEILKQNYYEIVEEIKEKNKTAKVLISGYYFPYPWINYNLKENASKVFNDLNTTIKEVSESTFVEYVDIGAVSKTENILSSRDIYLNQKGHDYIYNIFINKLNK